MSYQNYNPLIFTDSPHKMRLYERHRTCYLITALALVKIHLGKPSSLLVTVPSDGVIQTLLMMGKKGSQIQKNTEE